jgi:hypothetical protein
MGRTPDAPKPLATLVPSVGADLAHLIDSCLALAPAARPDAILLLATFTSTLRLPS